MIKASELRVGNYVVYGNQDIWKEIRAGDFIEIYNEPYLIKPIQLTSSILEKAGFSNDGIFADAEWYHKLIGIRTSNNGVCCFELSLFKTQYDDWGINLEGQYFGYCKHLHELQNKFHALTNEELEIQL